MASGTQENTKKKKASRKTSGKKNKQNLEKNKIRLTVLGGLGEIGKNMMCIEYDQEMIVIDSGLMFPNTSHPGVDYILPDYTYLEKNAHRIKGFIITHGHEDHIGALPFVLKKIKKPIYGTALTLGLIKNKLIEHDLDDKVKLKTVSPSQTITIGNFKIEFVHVTHSIPDGVGLIIRTPAGTIVHTGDFKIDHTPINEDVIDLYRFARAGSEGVLLLLSDSTNVERTGTSLSEMDLTRPLETIFSEASGRLIVASFASNINRIQQFIHASARLGRKVSLNGLSMQRNIDLALKLKYIECPDNIIIPLNDLLRLPPEKATIITTGSQGEPMSALSRIANDNHKQIKISKSDTVVISASIIPGNEKTVSKIVNLFFKKQIKVFYQGGSDIHASGHSSREELKLMLNMVKPKYFVPIHGESRHLTLHASLAESVKIKPENIFLLELGEILEFNNSAATVIGKSPAGEILIDGKGEGDIGNVVLRDRQILAEDGILIVSMVFDAENAILIKDPDIISRGLIYMKTAHEFIAELIRIVKDCAKSFDGKDQAALKTMVKDALRHYIRKKLDRQPIIITMINVI